MNSQAEVITNIGSFGYVLNAASYFILSILLLISWKKRLLGGLLLGAVLFQVGWSLLLALQAYTSQVPQQLLLVSDEIRLLIWNVFLLEVLRLASKSSQNKGIYIAAYAILAGILVLANLYEIVFTESTYSASHFVPYLLSLVLATFGLILTEQVYRNTRPDRRWTIKYLCIGVGVLFAYDLYMYSHATLFDGVNSSLWNARGFVNIVAVPLLAIAAARNRDWSVNVFVSRQVVFYTSGLFAVGVYLTLMAFGGYYIQIYGGIWSRETQIIFLAGALVVLFVIMSSGTLRARAKLFLTKHFYENKYDYREEWMGFIQKLSNFDSPKYLKEQILQNVATIMHSRGAMLFLKQDGLYRNITAWNTDTVEAVYPADSSLVSFLDNREWIIDVNEYHKTSSIYSNLKLPEDMESSDIWLIIPLKHAYDLIGFIVLLEPFVRAEITWEDRDLLKAVGKQVASYVALMMATESLAEAEKFTAFNRLSAFVVHDMKNSVAQLDLISKNAEKFKHNPEFIADALLTVANVVDRMKRMLSQLKRVDKLTEDVSKVNVNQVLNDIASKCGARKPKPVFTATTDGLTVHVEYDRFANIIEHLVNNAQDATPEDGEVVLQAERFEKYIRILVKDTGYGMSADFIANHLFKPFDTTKGNAGMGVGVFEAKEFVKLAHGQLNVDSKPGVGTIFEIILPEYNEEIAIESKVG